MVCCARTRRRDANHRVTAPPAHARRSEQTLHLILGWSVCAVIAAEFLLIPLRTRVWFPDWPGTINAIAWWAVGLLVIWVVVPTLLMRRDGPLPFSIAPPATVRGLGLYGLLLLLMVPALALASRRPDL